MILVTVGTHDRGFDRLVRAADELAARIAEPVVIQFGSSEYEPRHASRSFRFTSSQEMEELTSRAHVVIMHAAAGSLILALRLGKKLITVPRLRKYKEVMNDHQIQLAGALSGQKRVVLVMDPTCDSLFQAIRQAADLETRALDNSQLTTALRRQLDLWDVGSKKT